LTERTRAHADMRDEESQECRIREASGRLFICCNLVVVTAP
jgi:hypothetical protein